MMHHIMEFNESHSKVCALIDLLINLYKNKSILEKKCNIYWSLFQPRLVHFENQCSVPEKSEFVTVHVDTYHDSLCFEWR